MASMKFDLPLLDYKTRFALWQVKMRTILAQSSDLDEALDGFGGKGQKSWTAEDKRRDQLWLKLESICMSKDLTGKMHVKMKLFTHKLQEGGLVMNHLSIFKEIVADLVSMEVKYDDEDLALLLLCSLPTSFANFQDTILLSRDELTLAEVYEALQTREKMKGMVQSDVSSSKGEVLQVRGSPEQKTYNNNNNRDKSKNSKGRFKSRGRDKFCMYCKKDIHVIEDCWKLQNKEKKMASVVSVVDTFNSGDVLVVFASCVAGRDEWILDSACSFHICSNRDGIGSYESMQSEDVVRMGDNNPREIVGIGSVQIKMHDGMIRTLKDVRHIPGMARNLISLSTLDVEGYKHSGSGGVYKVSKGSLIHMIGDMNSAKLYVLRGSTLHDSVTAATVSNDEPSKTNLWHMRLGHMSELGMAELIKRDMLDGCTVGKMKLCEHCVFGKHKRVKFNASVHTTKGTLDYVHADLWGLSRKPSYGGARYMLTIIDDYSRKVWSYFLKNKDDTFAVFKEWKVMIERQTEKKHSPAILQPQNQSTTDHKTKRSCGPRPRLIEECDIVHYAFSCAEQVENINEPATYTEAVVSGDREKWISAMQEEIQSLKKNDTWDVVRLPKHKKVVRCKWIFKRKKGLSYNFTADLDKRRSLIGYVFTIGGCAVS
ncbi:unnamed protein product [Miscanthus lutarioriparius]|uniref:Uncharacterized protein n=1 Tax=Miscanthus lutarioriparius TaxID=422564 RepID=A0A811P5B5_9POAL|nr:unnamed protein product [Miscanthus lutarioriparius]